MCCDAEYGVSGLFCPLPLAYYTIVPFRLLTNILQRNFRKVMRSALAQVRGRVPDDFGEQQQRRREVLALYRWTGDGSGLAL